MDPKFRSSFIPKRPVASPGGGGKVKVYHSFNLITFLGTLIFIAALVGSGGAFAYQRILQGDVNTLGSQLAQVKDELDLTQIASDEQLASRLSTAKTLLQKHNVASLIFTMLERDTLHNVAWSGLSIKADTGMLTITAGGTASSYNALSLQEDVLERESLLIKPMIKGIKLGDTGQIEFTFSAQVDTGQIGYITVNSPSTDDSGANADSTSGEPNQDANTPITP